MEETQPPDNCLKVRLRTEVTQSGGVYLHTEEWNKRFPEQEQGPYVLVSNNTLDTLLKHLKSLLLPQGYTDVCIASSADSKDYFLQATKPPQGVGPYMTLTDHTLWQPIDTAPKDGTEVLVGWYFKRGYYEHQVWQDRGWGWDVAIASWEGERWSDWQRTIDPTPTHWMPLPAAPTPEPA
jgi:hypothetical protein